MAMHFERALSSASEFCLVLWILHCPVKTEVLVKAFNNQTLQTHKDQPASFGRSFPRDGLWGHLSYVEPEDGCSSVHRPVNGSDWIAVMSMNGKCEFETQVLNAQIAGFIAAIVHNNKSNDLIEMKAATHSIRIPSTFIGLSSSNLLSQFDRRLDVSIVIIEYGSDTEEILLITLAAVFSFSALVILGFVIGIGIRNCCKNRSQMLSWWKLKRLPVHVFKKGDLYDNCAICLEEYNEGDKLRVLPCAHAFHLKCIDVWLTKNRKTCPLCNETVNPRRRRRKRHAGSEEEQNDERRPLLMPVSNDGNSESEGNGELVRSQSDIEIHEEPSRYLANGRRNYGTTGASGYNGPEEDHLATVENVNSSGRSPLCRIEREPDLSTDVLACKTPGLPFEGSVDDCQKLVEAESDAELQEPEVYHVSRNSVARDCDDIV